MHVFADLQPYICTFQDCDYELVQFTTRAAWADHEFSCHRVETRWNCPECGSEEKNCQDWERHIQEHGLVFTGPELQVARTMARNSKARPIETEECLLCREWPAKSRRAFIKHVGRHMEEMALVALPRDTEDDSEGRSDLSSQDSDAIEHFVSQKDIQVHGEMKELESTRNPTHCPHCPRLLISGSTLRKHVLSTHKREFPCTFERYGCRARPGTKEEWKYHINAQHLYLEGWRCDLDLCAMAFHTVSAQFHDFNCKDSFTQHVKRMHGPSSLASQTEKAAFEAGIPALQERCYRRLRDPPLRSRCPYCSDKIFEGPGSWPERLEHVGNHLERNDVVIDDDVEDEDLRDWMMAHGLTERNTRARLRRSGSIPPVT